MMRVILVGTPDERAGLAAALPAGLVVVGEASTMGDARQVPVTADAWLVARDALDAREKVVDEPLTAREREVLDLLALGLSNKSIAVRLHISDQTVKFHVASIYGKLGAANRTDAVRRAIRQGLVSV